MEKLAIHNIQKLDSLISELEYERATSIYLKLRVFIKEDESYKVIRTHLRGLIKKYEHDNWANENSITDNQIIASDLAESLVQAENEFYNKRRELIKKQLNTFGLKQNDLAKILGHRTGYTSELVNGLRPFSKEDIVVINRLLKIKLDDLIPTFIKHDKALHIRKTLDLLSNNKIKLTKRDFDLQLV